MPGASRTLLDARVPYSTAALTAALGHEPSTFASAETAAAMAQEAYRSAAEFAALGADFVGVACTAALVTDRPKKGQHKVCGLAACSALLHFWSTNCPCVRVCADLRQTAEKQHLGP